MKAAITRSKPEKADDTCTIKITGATEGELRSLLNALGIWASNSPVARDVYDAVYAAATAPNGFPAAVAVVVNPDDQEYRVIRRTPPGDAPQIA